MPQNFERLEEIQKVNDEPFGIRGTLPGAWDAPAIRECVGENARGWQQLIRTNFFLVLRPELYVPGHEAEAIWGDEQAIKFPRSAIQPGSIWHQDGTTLALFCPSQEEEVIPTGFAPIEETRFAIDKILHQEGLPLVPIGREPENELYERYEGNLEELRPLLLRINHLLEENDALHWHEWKEGDCILLANNIYHVVKTMEATFTKSGGILRRLFFAL